MGQDAYLFEYFSRLVQRQGVKMQLGVAMCNSLGLPNDLMDRSVKQILYADQPEFEHAINVLARLRTQARYFIIYKRNTKTKDVEAYLLDFAGQPRAASSMNLVDGSEKWSRLSVDWNLGRPTRDSWGAELLFWRNKYLEIKAAPQKDR
jgi:hypothetical protein